MKKTMAVCMIMALVAGTASASIVWSEGFNSGFSNPYSASWGAQFGLTGPGIVTDGSIAGIEGDGFAAMNVNQAVGAPAITGGMDFSLGTVASAGVTYTFSGDFGWRYGTLASASDLLISYG
ncbi:MAG: hypothetical protein DRQ64_10105, partial [Gammaproteobacteria bacterium]